MDDLSVLGCKLKMGVFEVSRDKERVAYKTMVNGKPTDDKIVHLRVMSDINLDKYESLLIN
jgi:hypothetical protein